MNSSANLRLSLLCNHLLVPLISFQLFLFLSPRSSSRQAPDLTVILTAHRMPSPFFFVLSNLTMRSPILPLARSLPRTTSLLCHRLSTYSSHLHLSPPLRPTHPKSRMTSAGLARQLFAVMQVNYNHLLSIKGMKLSQSQGPCHHPRRRR